MSDSEDEEDDDEDRIREELKDLIDDAPIDDDSSDDDGEDSDRSRGNREKRKKTSDDEDELDDRLEDDDYDLIEENLGVKVKRQVSTPSWEIIFHGINLCFAQQKRFKRLRRNEDSDGEQEMDESVEREHIANQLFDGDRDDVS